MGVFSSKEVKQDERRNQLFNKFVQNAAMNTLMEALKELQQNTREWKKSKAGELCSHMHVECWNGKFMCSGCHQEVSDPERVSNEEQLMKNIGANDFSEPKDSVNRGVTIAFLVAICQYFDLYKVTAGEVLRDFIVPLTSGSRCRFVELEAMQKSGVVGRATTFISHCNKAEFGVLVAALCDGGADLTRRVWVDIFSVRQWPSSKNDLHFEVVIEQCPSFMVISPSPWEVRNMEFNDVQNRRFPTAAKAQMPFFRIWCLYEIYYAAKFDKPVAMICGSCELWRESGQQQNISFKSEEGLLIKMLDAIDVEQAEATVASDKDMLFNKILSYEGGMAGLNRKVRGVIEGAWRACSHPELVCASCGDAAAMAVVRERAEEYFSLAAEGGFPAVLQDLLLRDSNLIRNHKSVYGMTAFLLAAQGGHLTCLQLLVEKGTDITVANQGGVTALKLATRNGHVACKEYLLSIGAQ
eukprot:CAMPEP_0170072478 /NCGR_PEP_ID=MMETSP0019_2-20121128/10112_1 /TAXON_ID=98059 /ORGANISM="Dinobryon sp., Strain UTEXLB2267" /LENGTH=467 /DNA_ID=CAMNT_0010281481 /DNA_START=31 /DNA_END=1434 /DNA_ORIENTATION=-